MQSAVLRLPTLARIVSRNAGTMSSRNMASMGNKIPRADLPHTQQIGWGKSVFKKHPELTPVFAFVAGGCVVAVIYTIFAAVQKSDVRFNKMSDVAPWEKVDPRKQQKLMNRDMKYEPIPELEELRKEIGKQKN